MSSDLDQAFIEFDLRVPQVQLADLNEAMSQVSGDIEQILELVGNEAEPKPMWLVTQAKYLREGRDAYVEYLDQAIAIMDGLADDISTVMTEEARS